MNFYIFPHYIFIFDFSSLREMYAFATLKGQRFLCPKTNLEWFTQRKLKYSRDKVSDENNCI
jgi:hypothetical protein